MIAVCFLIGIILSFTTKSFLTLKNFQNILEANAHRSILAMGMMFIVASGAIDLSIGAILALVGVIGATLLKLGVLPALVIILMLVLGTMLGSFNGVLISATRINALIITLATSYLFRGCALIITRGQSISLLPDGFRSFGQGDILGIESGVYMAFAVAIIIFLLFYKTKTGVYITGLGSSAETLKRCGINSAKYRIGSFAAMGFLAALAAIIVTARLNSAENTVGIGFEMDAICAVIMGGTPMRGGRGSLAGTLVAVILLGLIRNGITLLSISPYYQTFITGAIMLTAVVTAEIRERRNRIVE
jgi:ribose/xylose/arabinose/galactoside ABC-type transport system permease subunit